MSRVNKLADRPDGFIPDNAIPARHLVPLVEILSEALSSGVNTAKVQREYRRLTSEHTEFGILLDLPEEDIKRLAGERTSEAISRVRRGALSITPGFDGEFGKIRIFSRTEEIKPAGPSQITLF